jgi:radical SAM protein with 4Fe4S-binding SPASM domain
MQRNLSELGNVAAYAREMGVTQIFIHPVIRRDPVPELFSEELAGRRLKAEFRQDLTAAVAAAREQYPDIVLTLCSPELGGEICLSSAPQPFPGSLPQGARISTCEQSPWNSLHVLANGDATVCEVLDRVPLGNLARQTLQEIWDGKAYREFRNHYLHAEVPECRECPWKVAYAPSAARSCIDAAEGMSPQLLRGWHLPQNESIIWSKGESTLCLKSVAGAQRIRIRGVLPHSADGQANVLDLYANDVLLGRVGNDSAAFAAVDCSFACPSHKAEIVPLRLTTRTVYRPSLHGMGNDSRGLGFGLVRAEAC